MVLENVDDVRVSFMMGSIVRLDGKLYWLLRGWNRSILARPVRQVSKKQFEFMEPPGHQSILRPDDLDSRGEYIGMGSRVVSEHLEIKPTRRPRRL